MQENVVSESGMIVDDEGNKFAIIKIGPLDSTFSDDDIKALGGRMHDAMAVGMMMGGVNPNREDGTPMTTEEVMTSVGMTKQ